MKTVFNKLIDISLNITDGVHNTVVDDANGDCFLLSAKNIKNGLVNFGSSDRKISNAVREKLNKRTKMSIGDVLFTTVGTLGETALVDENCEKYEFQRSVAIIKPNSRLIDNKYLYYLLKSNSYSYYFKSIATGAAQPCIFIGNLAKTKIEYFENITYQKRIADILSTYDELIENNNKRIAILEQMAENLYKEWFVRFRFPGYETAKFENGLPVGWEIQQAQNIFDITIGRTPDRKQFDYFTNNENDALWVSISDMKDNMFITRSSEYLTDEAINKVNMPMVEADTVLLSFKLSVGRVAITTKLSCTNEAIAHFKTKDKDLLEYTYLYLKLFNYQNLGNTSAIGNAVNSTIIKKMKFVLPDRNLLEMFHNSAKDIFTEIKNLKHSNENLIKQRDLLLPRLMSGKLEV